MEAPSESLVMSFDPKTIDHLGIKMYSQLPSAMAELVANAYDADASNVKIQLEDGDEKIITVEDDGIGMSFDALNEKFLRIGRNRREDGDHHTAKGRVATGKKGLGKLAFFGIAEHISIQTMCSEEVVTFALDWSELKATADGEDYQPSFKREQCAPNLHGTQITLSGLKRKSDFDTGALALSLSKLFNFSAADFRLFISDNRGAEIEVTNKMKFDDVSPEFDWEFPQCIGDTDPEYPHKAEIKGKLITTSKPLKAGMRGVTLYANGRLVNAPEFFGISESSHFFSYATGWLDIDFVDNWGVDVISTNRQSLDWEQQETLELRNVLGDTISSIHRDWRTRRQADRQKKISETTNINVPDWFSKLPDDISSKVSTVVGKIVDDSELSEADQGTAVSALHDLVPEYPHYHWRHLHPEIQSAAESDYIRKDYYRAFTEAAKRYIAKTREVSGNTDSSERGMMGNVYGPNKPLSVTAGYQKSDGSSFAEHTLNDIEEGQKLLSMGIVAGGRNPVSHEEVAELRESGLFTEKDCLDGLSLLSHLMTRLEHAP